MKHIAIIVLILFLSSCSGTKNTIEKQKIPKNKALIVTEVPDLTEKKDDIKAENTEIIEENIISENDSLGFNQILSKRILTEHQLWDELLQKHVSENGDVNYDSFKEEHIELLGYIKLLKISYEKRNLVTKRPQNELLAYWINAYNALTIDLIIRNYPLKSIKDIKDPWDQRLWKFGDKWLNLNDIEHKILRKMDEPRIHFAIVCASESCPKLQNEAFNAENLEEQLTNATKEFLSDTSKNEISQNNVKLSKIFKWFKKDFEQNGSLIDFINQYSEITISDKAKKNFKDYSWELNN
ncbi:DUF547 domain-containing protein [Winogradskyella sp. PE311]|uniref:DUF547 domain-containing protein n=1 Tax=Winogradskyella sp. PE311 TaxID=3366943 RepID=UPI00397FFF55